MKTNEPPIPHRGEVLSSENRKLVSKWSRSLFRPTIPANFIDKCIISEIADERANFLTAQFLYGARNGEKKEIPHDDSEITNNIADLEVETLWLYSGRGLDSAPEGFSEKKLKTFNIPTGKTKKCTDCRGSGKVTCSKCGGTRYYTEQAGSEKKTVACSCGDGKAMCSECDGYGKMQIVIECRTKFHVEHNRKHDYQGEIPQRKLRRSNGKNIFEEAVDYPKDKMTVMLQGGINPQEYAKLQQNVAVLFHSLVDKKLQAYDGDIKVVHSMVDNFIKQMPNPCLKNRLLEHEILPVRLGFKVEEATVVRVTYSYDEKPYTLWIYGNDRRIYAKRHPRAFTLRLAAILVALSVVIIAIVIRK
jgi:hypothetical protein